MKKLTSLLFVPGLACSPHVGKMNPILNQKKTAPASLERFSKFIYWYMTADRMRYIKFTKYERRVEYRPFGYSSSYDLNCKSNRMIAMFLFDRYIRRPLTFKCLKIHILDG
jgi:hypothetical protein